MTRVAIIPALPPIGVKIRLFGTVGLCNKLQTQKNKEPERLGVFSRLPKHGAWSDTYPGPDHVLKPHQRCATGRGHVPKPVHPFVPF
eukprot:scaffold12944_cov32-Phaeocystis_antarctica.AAC.1